MLGRPGRTVLAPGSDPRCRRVGGAHLPAAGAAYRRPQAPRRRGGLSWRAAHHGYFDRGCGQQGADFDNWPFDALARIAGADKGQRTIAAPAAANAAETTGWRDTREDARQRYSSQRHRSRAAYASAERAGAEGAPHVWRLFEQDFEDSARCYRPARGGLAAHCRIKLPKMIAPSRSGEPRCLDRGAQSRPRFP